MKITGKDIIENCRARGAVVLGFGISNVPLTEFLLRLGVSVTVRDGKAREQVEKTAPVSTFEERGVRFIFGEGYLDDIGPAVIFRTPGLRPDAEGIVKALEKGAILTSEMELFYALTPAHRIAITGSDGKTTTTTLTHLILSEAFSGSAEVGLGGNIGAPLLPRVDELGAGDYAVTELSSFQLMTMPTPPETAVITNITPNHLNWHTGMEEYIEAKLRVIGEGCRRAVLNYNNPETRAAAGVTSAKVTFFSSTPVPDTVSDAVYLDGDSVILRLCGKETVVLRRGAIKLPGLHNVENYMAAIAVAAEYMDAERLALVADKVARTFGGVPHRLEFVREIGGINCYNGSIDSTPTRTAAALSALPERKISLIVGGYDKQIPMEPLADAIIAHGGVVSVTVTGAVSGLIRSVFEKRAAEIPEFAVIDDFDLAVSHAYSRAAALCADTLLLSPACASFDRFRNFEERGEHYKDLVRAL